MRLDDLFISRRGNDLDRKYLVEVEPPQGVNYVSRVGGNNGVSGRVLVPDEVTPESAGSLTVALGSRNYALATFVQPENFVTGQNIQVLEPRDSSMTLKERLWWAACITANRYRFSYGRHANRTLNVLELPDGPPAWLYDRADSTLDVASSPTASANYLSFEPIAKDQRLTWQDFRIDDLFEIKKGTRLTKAQRVQGKTPFVAATMTANGWVDHVNKDPDFPARSISVPYNGGVGHAFLQPFPYCASDDISVLIPYDDVPIGARLFVCVMIRAESYRFSYGRKWNLDRMRSSTLRLPVNDNALPDWDLMHSWIGSRPFSKIALGNSDVLAT